MNGVCLTIDANAAHRFGTGDKDSKPIMNWIDHGGIVLRREEVYTMNSDNPATFVDRFEFGLKRQPYK